jgi:lipopolysaccharide export system protein LptA
MTALSRSFRYALLGLCLMSAPALAQSKEAAPRPAGEMIDISAEESLEYYKEKQLYVARGKAKAIKGDMTVEADLLTAHQRTASPDAQASAKTQGQSNIDFLTAEGNVRIYDTKQQVFGDKAVYNVDEKAFKVTGNNLKYLTATDIVTATDSLEYYDDRKTAIARGRAIGEHKGSRVEGDVLSAQFAQNEAGQMEMTQLFAKGNVLITTKDGGLSRGDDAVYDVKKNIAILTKNVKITRGETQLAGDKAEVDFTTGQSRLLNKGSGRVRALLPTSNQNKPQSSVKKGTP